MFSIATLARKKKFQVQVTEETISVPDYRIYGDIPLCITWTRRLSGAKELISSLRAHGFKFEHSKHTTVAWAPLGWTQYIDHEGSVRFFDETGVLRAIRKSIDERLPEMTFYTRLEYGYNLHTDNWYLYDRQTGKVLATCKSWPQMQDWIVLYYPKLDDPAAYRGCTLAPVPEQEIHTDFAVAC